jgi:quercetin dioxygenase-like cupin family protein
MKISNRSLLPALTLVASTLLGVVCPASAQESTRTELRRTDLSGAPGMEVVLSISELKPGDELPAHFHHGVEAGYVLAGGMVKPADKPAYELVTGASLMNIRDVVHGGFKVVGDKTVKLLTVHVVDKGKPLYDASKK